MGFMRRKTTGYSAIIPTTDVPWKAMFLRGNRVTKIHWGGRDYEGPISGAYGTQLAGIPEPFATSAEGVLQLLPDHGRQRTVFFHGDNYLTWDWGVGEVGRGTVVTHQKFGPLIPADFRTGVDVALELPNVNGSWRTLLFKRDRCVLIHWDAGIQYQGPISGMTGAGWSKLPEEFNSDFDHAIHLNQDGSTLRTLFIKGDRGLVFHWEQGPEKSGLLSGISGGLASLPTEYSTLMRPVTGRYTGTVTSGPYAGGYELDFRVDLDGARPLGLVSGEEFELGPTRTLYSSFTIDNPQVTVTPTTVTASGRLSFQQGILPATATLSLDRKPAGATDGTGRFTITSDDGAEVTPYNLVYTSPYLRSVDWEIDTVTGTRVFGQYNTADHPRPAGVTTRALTVAACYADAGIEIRTAGTANQVAVDSAGADLRWSNAELHAAMVANFSGYREVPQWKVWTLVATRHADAGTLGIMFDQSGLHRQGAAVLYNELINYNLAGGRNELHTYVHELGHAFNLLHSWQKYLANPPQPLGPSFGYGDLSWMNYDWKYEGDAGSGDAAYWSAFPFIFTDSELRHLRHGYLDHVIMGGKNFGSGSGSRTPDADRTLAALATPLTDESGLRLELSGKRVFGYGEPVAAELRLSLDGTRPSVDVVPDLDPSGEHLTLAVTDPAGVTRLYRPLLRACRHLGRRTLTDDDPAVYDSVYLGYGADGLTFDTPGRYRLRAVYLAPGGARVVSADQAIRVRHPVEHADQHAGELLLDDQQGTLLALLGSDAPQLRDGNDALAELIDRYPDHPLTLYARMVKGTNAGRHFLTLADGAVEVRPADTAESIAQLTAVVRTTVDPAVDAGVDNITLNQTMRRLARAHARAGDLDHADTVLDELVDTFRARNVPAPVLAAITDQAEAARTRLHTEEA
ncbi:hypothetical protein [Rhizohabitans arisaemae]|uniref:hypothetical protein n=1 Tax=Rhizohabitans arisaemae TaxID=2720610 RepID=UPI0024B155D4|nr:hypothetical protein [Rhizohabitans arisaemae]